MVKTLADEATNKKDARVATAVRDGIPLFGFAQAGIILRGGRCASPRNYRRSMDADPTGTIMSFMDCQRATFTAP
jgi:hypothetical protein